MVKEKVNNFSFWCVWRKKMINKHTRCLSIGHFCWPRSTNQMINMYSNEFQLKQFHCNNSLASPHWNHLVQSLTHTLAQSYGVRVDDWRVVIDIVRTRAHKSWSYPIHLSSLVAVIWASWGKEYIVVVYVSWKISIRANLFNRSVDSVHSLSLSYGTQLSLSLFTHASQ